jgi:hypothetical protein
MPVSFEQLRVGQKYERPHLANTWGYKGFQAISKGVVTPANTKYIILFVTKQKQKSLTQYNDYLDGDYLHWEGEEKHASDKRIIGADAKNDEIHLFYRDVHHTPFTYHGQIRLEESKLHTKQPSSFVFKVGKDTFSGNPIHDVEEHKAEYQSLNQTEKEAIVKSRVGQGLFRERLIAFWGGCSVTNLRNISLLRASHIKPWRDSSNNERLDPMNGLLLNPTLDHLFDQGLISFDDKGMVIFSPRISRMDIAGLNLPKNIKLREVPEKLAFYMKFHREHVLKGC